MITVGIGRFTRGRFSRISAVNLSTAGGTVAVGPYSKTEDTRTQIKTDAFRKFSSQNQYFRKAYRNPDQFMLVYPDGTEVNALPDGTDTFTLLGYRNFIDPRCRFERLRLYLCQKDKSGVFEVITDESSDEELPEITLCSRREENTGAVESNNSEESTCSENKSIPSEADSPRLVAECHFIIGKRTIHQSFPNNIPVTTLMKYVGEQCSADDIALVSNGKVLTPDQRLSHLPVSNGCFNIAVDISEELRNCLDDPIPGSYDSNGKHKNTIQAMVSQALLNLGDASEPTLVIKEYGEVFLKGRPLDTTDESDIIEGETSMIFVSRGRLLLDSVVELFHQENIRYPIQVSFLGEMALDHGGPRREYFTYVIKEIYSDLIEEDSGELLQNTEYLFQKKYFYAGLLIALSILEGGPAAEYVSECLRKSTRSECLDQFKKGLDHIGILTLISKKPSLDFLFRPNPSRRITLNRLLSLLKVEWSEEGSNRRLREENTYRFFIKYLREIHAGRRTGLNLAMVLRFITSSEEEPILGYRMAPTVKFADLIYPMASTCTNTVTLPILSEITDIAMERFDMAFLNQYYGLE